MDVSLFVIYYLVEEHLGDFQFGGIRNKATKKIEIHIFKVHSLMDFGKCTHPLMSSLIKM